MLNSQFNSISQGIQNLSVVELEELMKQIVSLRKQKMPSVLPQIESELLRKINMPLSASILKRYKALLKKRNDETLTDTEYDELLELTTFVESHNNKRLEYLLELAKLRNLTFDELMEALDIKPKLYVA